MGAAIGLTAVVGLLAAPTGTTFAAYSDSAHVSGNTAGAGIWAPDPPDACGDPATYARVVYGTPGDDVLIGGNQRQVLMGLGGDDVLRGGNSGDCLVGGLGSDRIYGGHAKDVLVGGESDDLLDGSNGKDLLDGGPGLDTCVGGNGVDVLQACEAGDVEATAPLRLSTVPLPPGPGVPASPDVELMIEAAPQSDGGASVEDPPEAPLVDLDGIEPTATPAEPPPVDATDEVQP